MMLIEPAAEITELKKHWANIQELKRSILEKSDIQDIQGKPYVKRSGWRKLQSAFAISDRILSKEREDLGENQFLWRVEVEAFHARTGRSATGLGTCASTERKFAHPDHDILAIAHTRAKNRAISDLIGLGEVSFEEIEAESTSDHPPPSPPTLATAEEICSCGCSKSKHLSDGTKVHCWDCTKAGKNVQCSLKPWR
jgi:hypothetical protein